MYHRRSPGILLLSLLATFTYPALLQAGDEIEESKPADPNGIVSIKNVRGDLEILGWDKAEIKVEGELDDLTKKFTFRVDGDKAQIEIHLPRFNVNHGDGSDLKIHVPIGSRVSFQGVSTDTVIKDIHGGVRIDSVSGEIDVEHTREMLLVKTVSGDIDVNDATGDARISTVSGELDVEIEGENLTLESISGDIDGRFETFSTLRSTTVSGTQKLRGLLNDSGDISISSVSGDIMLELQESVNARISAKTGIGGEIENDLSDHEPQVKFPSQGSLQATLGDGSGKIHISTVSADIRLDHR